jgi:hypothetical protein
MDAVVHDDIDKVEEEEEDSDDCQTDGNKTMIE